MRLAGDSQVLGQEICLTNVSDTVTVGEGYLFT